MIALDMEDWKEIRRNNKCKVAPSNDKLVVAARVIHKRNIKGDKVEKYRCRSVAYGFWQVKEVVHYSPTPATE